MCSPLPKVLHPLAGRPLLGHVVGAARAVNPQRIVIVHGHGGDAVRQCFADCADLTWVEQEAQNGTGDAVACALPQLAAASTLMVLYGDVPLVTPETLQALLDVAGEGVGLLTTELDDPTGYGRIVRGSDGALREIVEERDADEAVRRLTEVNTGILVAPSDRLRAWVARLDSNNAQGELYLTDTLAMAVDDGLAVHTLCCAADEVLGINDREQLATAERTIQRRQARRLMRAGVSLADPARFDLRGELRHGSELQIDIDVIIEGEVVTGDNVHIGPFCTLRNCTIGSGSRIESHSVIEGAVVGAGCRVGPFARLRPGTELAQEARVGNFVETKQTLIGVGSKVNHLSYIGDSEIGDRVNVGAGTITCNYDGARKHRTKIGDDAFIGSNSQLVAPVSIGAGATIGAGSTITRDVAEGELALSRGKQRSVSGWKRPTKAEE